MPVHLSGARKQKDKPSPNFTSNQRNRSHEHKIVAFILCRSFFWAPALATTCSISPEVGNSLDKNDRRQVCRAYLSSQ